MAASDEQAMRVSGISKRTLDRYTKKVLTKYLTYKCNGCFQRPPLVRAGVTMGPEEAMFRYESLGEPLPDECTNPARLADYIQGKTNRDFQMEQWRLDGIFERRHWVEPNGHDLGCLLLPEEIALENPAFEDDLRSACGENWRQEVWEKLKREIMLADIR